MAAAGRRITTHEATVKTAAVEIKTLSVSGKQVTLALFRQLKEEPLIDPETQTFRGLPWGTVNYCPSKECDAAGEHVHVVWQVGIELRRAAVSRHGALSLPLHTARQKEARALIDFCGVALASRTEPVYEGQRLSERPHCADNAFSFTLPGFPELQAYDWPGREIHTLWKWRSHDPRHRGGTPLQFSARIKQHGATIQEGWKNFACAYFLESTAPLPPDLLALTSEQLKEIQHAERWLNRILEQEARVEEIQSERRDIIKEAFGYEVVSLEDAMTHLERVRAEMGRIKREWGQRYDELLALDQLFIAV